MDDSNLIRTIGNVFGYAVMEFVSFVVLTVVLKRKLKISGIHQLAFVLEKQWRMVQSKLVLWVVFMLQSTLVHLGKDAKRNRGIAESTLAKRAHSLHPSCSLSWCVLAMTGADYSFKFAWLHQPPSGS